MAQPVYDEKRANDLLNAITAAWDKCDADALLALGVPGTMTNTDVVYLKAAMSNRFKVKASELVQPFQTPDWFAKGDQFQPPPLFGIWIDLHAPDGKRTDRYYACGEHDGRYVVSHYIPGAEPPEATKAKKTPSPKATAKKLTRIVTDAARSAFTAIRAANPDEHFYAFALYTDDGMMTCEAAANSEEGYERTVKKYKTRKPDEKRYYRWATSEWAYEGDDDEQFTAAYDLINATDFEEVGEKAAWLLSIMTDALKTLDKEGLFGTGKARQAVTLFVSITDSDDAEDAENQSAAALNPPAVAKAFAERYDG